MLELATLLEGAGCVQNISIISKYFFTLLWWKLAVKLDNCWNEVYISAQRTTGRYQNRHLAGILLVL